MAQKISAINKKSYFSRKLTHIINNIKIEQHIAHDFVEKYKKRVEK